MINFIVFTYSIKYMNYYTTFLRLNPFKFRPTDIKSYQAYDRPMLNNYEHEDSSCQVEKIITFQQPCYSMVLFKLIH